MTPRNGVICGWTVAVLLAATTAKGEPPTSSGPVAITIDAPTKPISLAEPVTFEITVAGPENLAVTISAADQKLNQGKAISCTADAPDRIRGETATFVLRRFHLRVEPLAVGTFSFGKVKVAVLDVGKAAETTEADLPTVTITPVAAKTEDSAQLLPPPDLVPLRSSGGFGKLATQISGATVLILFALLWARTVWKTANINQSSKKAAALAMLDQLAATIATVKPREAIVVIGNVLRDYLRAAYGLPTLQQTTAEFLSNAATTAALAPCQRDGLVEFLQAADCDKFARPEPAREECERCLRRARAFLAGEPELA